MNPPVTPRPLGLPPGSVRGMLSLMIMAMAWLLLMLPDSSSVTMPLNLYCLLPLVLLFFFSHGKSIAESSDVTPSPLHLPGGTLRLLILGGTIAVIAYLYFNHPDRLHDRLKPTAEQLKLWPTLMGAIVGGLIVGYLFQYFPFHDHWFMQALQAWLAILTMFIMLAEVVIQAFIAPQLAQEINMANWQWLVTFLAAFYFGSRS